MPSLFFNRDKETGRHHTRSGVSAAPHLYLSAKKAAAQVSDRYEQVEVMLIDATKPATLTPAQVKLALDQAARLGEDVTEEGDVVPTYSFSTVELQMLFNRVLTIAHGNGQAITKN